VFAIQEEIATTIAALLRGGALSRHERSALKRPQTAAETYEWFLRGRQHLHRLGRRDLDLSREMFERAIALDRRYTPAWAGLAVVHALLYEWWGARDADLEQTDRASLVAMQSDPDNACANIARGYALAQFGRYADARQHFEAAIRISPNLFEAYYYFGRQCFARGDIERAADLFRRSTEIRREDFQSALLLAQTLRMLGRGDDARAAMHEGLARAERILDLNPLDGRALSLGSNALYEDGQTQRAMEWSQRSLELHPDDVCVLVNAACLQVRAGMKTRALDLLERAFEHGWGKRAWIEQDPDYDAVRDDPRFRQLLGKLK
jgi:adenylate cyclase